MLLNISQRLLSKGTVEVILKEIFKMTGTQVRNYLRKPCRYCSSKRDKRYFYSQRSTENTWAKIRTSIFTRDRALFAL